MEYWKVAVIVGLLTLIPIATAFADPGGDEGNFKTGNQSTGVCIKIVSHDCGMISSPIPRYPSLPELVDAECVISYRVKDDGRVSVLSASCDDERFIQNAVQGMSLVRYKTHDACGEVCSEVGRTFEQDLIFTPDVPTH